MNNKTVSSPVEKHLAVIERMEKRLFALQNGIEKTYAKAIAARFKIFKKGAVVFVKIRDLKVNLDQGEGVFGVKVSTLALSKDGVYDIRGVVEFCHDKGSWQVGELASDDERRSLYDRIIRADAASVEVVAAPMPLE